VVIELWIGLLADEEEKNHTELEITSAQNSHLDVHNYANFIFKASPSMKAIFL
jgi:hypothetical protein